MGGEGWKSCMIDIGIAVIVAFGLTKHSKVSATFNNARFAMKMSLLAACIRK